MFVQPWLGAPVPTKVTETSVLALDEASFKRVNQTIEEVLTQFVGGLMAKAAAEGLGNQDVMLDAAQVIWKAQQNKQFRCVPYRNL